MNQAVNPWLNFDERSKMCDIAYASAEYGSRGIAHCNPLPWVDLELFHSKRDLLGIMIDTENGDLDYLAQ